MNRKKMYEKPSLEVVELKQQEALLAGSGGLEKSNGYTGDTDPFAEP